MPDETAGREGGVPRAHHFDTSEQQHESGRLGMWLFLATEILLFGGLFSAYAVYRGNHPEVFLYAHKFLSVPLGALNTMILITSSLTMAWAVRAAQLGKRRLLIVMLSLTLAGACGFLGVKAIEYEQKWKHGLLWGARYRPQQGEEHGASDRVREGSHAAERGAEAGGKEGGPDRREGSVPPKERSQIPPARIGPRGLAPESVEESEHGHLFAEEPKNVQTFFAVYFAMTGLHGVHVLAGMAVIAWVLIRSIRGDFSTKYNTPVDLAGLYWHLVDLIWIFLFPLLYLIH